MRGQAADELTPALAAPVCGALRAVRVLLRRMSSVTYHSLLTPCEILGRAASDIETPPAQPSGSVRRIRTLFDHRALIYVLAAAEQLSFSAAANVLNVQVSSVSRGVRDLEDAIGVSLFERARSGVRLTKAGERFIAEVTPALRAIRAAYRNAELAGRAESGIVRVGITTTLAGGFLRDVVMAFRTAFPDVDLEIRDGGRQEHLRAIRARELDVIFVAGVLSLQDCDVEELWRERLHVAMGVEHPLADTEALDWKQLVQERFIVPVADPGPEVHSYILRRIARYNSCPTVCYHHVSRDTLLHMVAIGEGVTLVSESWTNMCFPELAICPLSAPEDIVPFCAVWSPARDNPVLRRFLSFAREKASQQPIA